MSLDTRIEPVQVTIEEDDDEERPDSVEEALEAPRSRRALLAGVAAAAGALVAQAATAPLPVGAANGSNVKVGQTNTGTATTTVKNTVHSASAKGLLGQTSWTGSASSSSGVYGESKGAGGVGVQGKAGNGTTARGVLGRATSGIGVRGQGGAEGVWGTGGTYGVHGDTPSSTGYGVFGTGGTYGVVGTGSSYGVFGASSPYGVAGTGSTLGVYGSGGTYGAYGAGSAYGLYGFANSNNIGVYGTSGGSGTGVYGQGGSYGVRGSGVYAVYGTGSSYGGYFAGTGSSAWGLYAQGNGSYAAVFGGPVYVTGALTKAGGGFQVDHPLEPQRRYLIHSFVEGPERMNIYRGTIKLNARGRATIRLPQYFEAANRDSSYQLTAVGAAAPSLHVARGVQGNRFIVAGGAPGQTVSWQVSATRDDAWARKNPLRVEQLKAKGDRGKYLLPGAMGKPASAGILHVARAKAGPKPKALPKPRLKSA